jgi:hypothetical protein
MYIEDVKLWSDHCETAYTSCIDGSSGMLESCVSGVDSVTTQGIGDTSVHLGACCAAPMLPRAAAYNICIYNAVAYDKLLSVSTGQCALLYQYRCCYVLIHLS